MRKIEWEITRINADESSLFYILVKQNEIFQRGRDLPDERRRFIQEAAAKVGLDIYQAFSLRRQMILWSPMGFRNKVANFVTQQSLQFDYAIMFETLAEKYLAKIGIERDSFITESKIKSLLLDSLNERILERSGNSNIDKVKADLRNQWQMGYEGWEGPCFICLQPFTIKNKPASDAICSPCRIKNETIEISHGRQVTSNATPDILFKEPIIINNQIVNWIDFKAYYASFVISSDKRHKFAPLNKVPNQIKRYNEAYGRGALVFLRGFHQKLAEKWESLHGCLLLDTTGMDISEFNN